MLGLLEEGNFCTGCKEMRENDKEGRKEGERKENVGNKERKQVGKGGKETKGTGKQLGRKKLLESNEKVWIGKEVMINKDA